MHKKCRRVRTQVFVRGLRLLRHAALGSLWHLHPRCLRLRVAGEGADSMKLFSPEVADKIFKFTSLHTCTYVNLFCGILVLHGISKYFIQKYQMNTYWSIVFERYFSHCKRI
jgi:hypothetical protein